MNRDRASDAARLDIQANRKARKWSRREQFLRVLWTLCTPLFRLSPRPLWAWRTFILRRFGASIGKDVHIYPSVRVTMPWNLSIADEVAIGDRAILYALGPIAIGAATTISQGAHICAGSHAFRSPAMDLIKAPITIGERVWVCADAFIGPGVTVEDGAVVGARGVVMRNVPADVIVAGNPAVVIGRR